MLSRRPGSRRGARPPLDAEGLYAKAVTALARRGRSESELRRLLQPRARSAAALAAALARLRGHGYLNDARMAESAAAFQKDVARHGRARALRDLRARGVAATVAESAVERVYGSSGSGLSSADEDALLRAYIQKKRLQRPQELRQAASLFRKLLVAGFSPDACRRSLRAWRLDAAWIEALDNFDAVETVDEV